MRHLEAARGPPFGPQLPTATQRGSAATHPELPARPPSRAYAAPGLTAWATAPFRSFSAPVDCRTAPGTLSLRPSAVQVGFRGELACRGLHHTWTLGSARLHRALRACLSRTAPGPNPLPTAASGGWPKAYPRPSGGAMRVPCASWLAQRLPGGHRVSGLEPGGPAWPRCVSRRRGVQRGLQRGSP